MSNSNDERETLSKQQGTGSGDGKHAFSVVDVWSDMVSELRTNAGAILRAVLIPALIITLIDSSLASNPNDQGIEIPFTVGIVASLVSALVGVMLAVSCHRLVLQDESALGHPLGVYFDRRVGAYALTCIGIFLMTMIFGLVAIGAPTVLLESMSSAALSLPLFVLGLLATIYLLGRLSLVLPARAIGEPMTMEQAWTLADGRSIRAVFAAFFPTFFVGIGLSLPGMVVAFGSFEGGATGSLTVVQLVWNALATFVLGILGAVGLSCTYRSLRHLRPAPAY